METEEVGQGQRIEILGIHVDALSMEESIGRATKILETGRKGHQHVVVNAAKIVAASEDRGLRAIINNADIINADGQSVVWAGRLLGANLPERVAGIDFMRELTSNAAIRGWSVFLIGATASVIDAVQAQLTSMDVNVVGAVDGYWRKKGIGDDELVRRVSEANADLLFVALPSPMKEEFLSANLRRLNVGLAVGVGGTFDVVAGKTRRAPVLLQKSGMEWLYRLAQEPRRMFVRYAVGNTRFLMLLLNDLLQGRRAFPVRNLRDAE